MYYSELNNEILNNIKVLLEKGIIVYLFLDFNFYEELQLNEFTSENFKYALENRFLNVYDNIQELCKNSYKEGMVAYDGHIMNKEFYKSICCLRECEFNKEQYEIINCKSNSDIIVKSGAGTGKTTAMIGRLMFLRKTLEGFTFDKAVLITFTNEASKEMKERLLSLIEKYYILTKDINYLFMMDEVVRGQISTIHSFGKAIIDELGKNINITKEKKISSFVYYRKRYIEEALDEYVKTYPQDYERIKYIPLYEVVGMLNRMWNKLDNYSIDINNAGINFGNDENNLSNMVRFVLRKANDSFQKKKLTHLEISDIIKLLDNDKLISKIDFQYKIIMVDEFQDSDNVQIKFIYNLSEKLKANLFVVGDEKQSIYRFRGAEHTAFTKLSTLLRSSKKELHEFSMLRNYRTKANLLAEIDKLFCDIDRRVSRFNYKEEDRIYSLVDKNKEEKIQYINFNEEEQQVFLKELLNNKKDEEEVVVLVRNNSDVFDIKYLCDNAAIPCIVEAAGGFYRHEAVRDFYIMVCSLIYSWDSRVKYSFVKSPYINCNLDKEKIISLIGEDENELIDYLNSILQEHQWNDFAERMYMENPLILIDKIIENFKPEEGYYNNLLSKFKGSYENYENRAMAMAVEYKLNLDHLVYELKKNFSDKMSSLQELESFLRIKISTDNTIDARKINKNLQQGVIKCMTVHKAKGLEFDYVVVPRLNNKFNVKRSLNVIINDNSTDDLLMGFSMRLGEEEFKNDIYSYLLKNEQSEVIGEEARLLYVALTRCKKRLFINKTDISCNTSINSWHSLISGGVENV